MKFEIVKRGPRPSRAKHDYKALIEAMKGVGRDEAVFVPTERVASFRSGLSYATRTKGLRMQTRAVDGGLHCWLLKEGA